MHYDTMQSMHDAPFNVGQVAIERPASGQMPCGACMLHRAYVLHKTAELDQMPDLGADSRAQLVQELEDNAFDPSTGPGGMRKRSAQLVLVVSPERIVISSGVMKRTILFQKTREKCQVRLAVEERSLVGWWGKG